jgi:hypothetical protein
MVMRCTCAIRLGISSIKCVIKHQRASQHSDIHMKLHGEFQGEPLHAGQSELGKLLYDTSSKCNLRRDFWWLVPEAEGWGHMWPMWPMWIRLGTAQQ